MVARVVGGLGELADGHVGRGQVRVAEAEVDDVPPGSPRRRLQVVDGGEDVGRQPVDAAELHRGSLRPRPCPPDPGTCPSGAAAATSSSTSTGHPNTAQLAPAASSAATRAASGGVAAGGGPAQVTSMPSGPPARSATTSGSASHTVRAAPAARASSVRPALPPATQTVRPCRTSARASVDQLGPALGSGREGDPVGAVLLLAQPVAGAEPGDHPPRRQPPRAMNCAASTALGTRPTRATSVPKNGPSRAASGTEPRRQRAEDREGRQRRPLGLAEGPDVVVAEQAVHARPHGLVRGGERLVGRVPERGQHDTGPDHHSPPWRAASAAPTAPARSPKAAGTITGAAGARRPRAGPRRSPGPRR